jgi:hypothetical protein
MLDPKGGLKAAEPRGPESRPHDPRSGDGKASQAGSNLLFLREDEIRAAQDLLFFAYRDFTNAADVILEELVSAAPTTARCTSSAATRACR